MFPRRESLVEGSTHALLTCLFKQTCSNAILEDVAVLGESFRPLFVFESPCFFCGTASVSQVQPIVVRTRIHIHLLLLFRKSAPRKPKMQCGLRLL